MCSQNIGSGSRAICLLRSDGVIRIWDGIGIDNNNVRTQMAREGQEYLQYIYPPNQKQTNEFECGDLCFAKAIEILNGNDPSTIEFGTAAQIRRHTATLLITKSIKPYPKATNKQFAYTPSDVITFKVLKCCLYPSHYGISIYEQNEVRKFIGYAPQSNTLFDKLTAVEHLRFYGLLKGLNAT
eukprot:966000_1